MPCSARTLKKRKTTAVFVHLEPRARTQPPGNESLDTEHLNNYDYGPITMRPRRTRTEHLVFDLVRSQDVGINDTAEPRERKSSRSITAVRKDAGNRCDVNIPGTVLWAPRDSYRQLQSYNDFDSVLGYRCCFRGPYALLMSCSVPTFFSARL